MANFWTGFGQGFQGGFQSAYNRAAKRRDIKEAREQARADQREVMEAEAGAYDEINKELREKLAELKRQEEIDSITDPNDPRLSVLNNQVPMPTFEEGEPPELSMKDLIQKRITGKATQASLSGRIAELKKLQAAQKLREQQRADIKDQRDYESGVRQKGWNREDEIAERAAAAKTKEQTDQHLFKLAEITGETPERPPSDAYEAAAWVGRAKNDQNEATKKREQLVNFAPNVLKQFEDAGSAGQPMPELDYRYEDIIPAGLAEQAYNSARTLAKSTDRKTKLADAKKLADAEVQSAGDLVQFGLKPPTADNFLSPNGMTGYYAAKALASKKKEAYEAVQSVEGQKGLMGLPKLSLSHINNTSFEDLDHIINGHKTLAAQQQAAKELGQKAKEKMLPSFQGKPSNVQTSEYLSRLRENLAAETDPSKRKIIEQQIDDLAQNTSSSITLPDGTRIQSGSGKPSSSSQGGEGLSSKEEDTLNAAKLALNQANNLMDRFGAAGADNLTVMRRAENAIRNIALPSVGINNFEDPKMQDWRSQADALSAVAMSATHKMFGGGMMSQADVYLYQKAIPTTNTYSPVAYVSQFKAWQERLQGLVNYQEARQSGANLPEFMSDLTPEEAFSNAGKRAEGSKKVIISYDDVEFMAKNMPQYKYIDGNKRNPVTFEYVMQAVQDGKISKGDAEIWIESADIPYPKQGN